MAIWGYAVMSNHLHVVVQTLPEVVAKWSDLEVASRWIRLFSRQDLDAGVRSEVLAGNAERVAILRERLSDLSWFMRCLSEPIARAANKEDICKGRFWEGRFKCQVLLDETAVIAAMAYVDLNPVRAKICETLEASAHTSARKRISEIERHAPAASQALAPVAGVRGFGVLAITQADYLSLVDFTGRLIRPDKRGAVSGPPPAVLARLGYRDDQWLGHVQAVRSDFSRAMGTVESLMDKAAEIGQRWFRGVATARRLAKV